MCAVWVAVFGESVSWVESGRESYGDFSLSNELVWWMIAKLIINGFFLIIVWKKVSLVWFFIFSLRFTNPTLLICFHQKLLSMLGNKVASCHICLLLPCLVVVGVSLSLLCSCFVQSLLESFPYWCSLFRCVTKKIIKITKYDIGFPQVWICIQKHVKMHLKSMLRCFIN